MDGATGVTVDSAGKPVLVIAVCKGQMENVFLYASGGRVPVGEWQTERVSAKAVEVPVLANASAQWTVSAAPAALTASTAYSALAQSSDKKWEMRQVDFTVADVSRLDSHTVLYARGRTARSTFYANVCQQNR